MKTRGLTPAEIPITDQKSFIPSLEYQVLNIETPFHSNVRIHPPPHLWVLPTLRIMTFFLKLHYLKMITQKIQH